CSENSVNRVRPQRPVQRRGWSLHPGPHRSGRSKDGRRTGLPVDRRRRAGRHQSVRRARLDAGHARRSAAPGRGRQYVQHLAGGLVLPAADPGAGGPAHGRHVPYGQADVSAATLRTALGERTIGPSPAFVRGVDMTGRWAAPVASAAVLLGAALFVPKFYEPGNLTVVAIQAAVLGIVAVGQMLVLLVAGLDLSVNAVLGLGAVIVISNQQGFSALTLVEALLIAVGVGLANGLLVAWRRVPPFIATFGMLIFVGGARLAYTHGQASGNVPAWLRVIGIGQIGPLPNALLTWILIMLVAGGILTYTRYGRYVYAVGANYEAARYAGVPTREVVVACYIACSVLALCAGLVLSGYIGYVDQRLGTDFNVNSIAAAIVGGTTFSGGR